MNYTVSLALDAVYNGTGQEHRKADRWLQEFQQSPEAWKVADAMLMIDNAGLQMTFFAAHTIHAKIQYDFRELPQESIPSLRDSLIGHLTRWSGSATRAVITNLCLSVVSTAEG
ncbi:unnamed protein product [Discosporangium mesarthrocarpum]